MLTLIIPPRLGGLAPGAERLGGQGRGWRGAKDARGRDGKEVGDGVAGRV